MSKKANGQQPVIVIDNEETPIQEQVTENNDPKDPWCKWTWVKVDKDFNADTWIVANFKRPLTLQAVSRIRKIRTFLRGLPQ